MFCKRFFKVIQYPNGHVMSCLLLQNSLKQNCFESLSNILCFSKCQSTENGLISSFFTQEIHETSSPAQLAREPQRREMRSSRCQRHIITEHVVVDSDDDLSISTMTGHMFLIYIYMMLQVLVLSYILVDVASRCLYVVSMDFLVLAKTVDHIRLPNWRSVSP